MRQNRCQDVGAVGARGGVDLVGDGQHAGEEKQRDIADVGPDDHGRHHRQREAGIGEPFDAMPQHGADRAVGGRQDPAPQHRDRQRDADPRQHVKRAEQPAAGQIARQQRRGRQPEHRLRRDHDRHERSVVTSSELPKLGVAEHRPPILAADIVAAAPAGPTGTGSARAPPESAAARTRRRRTGWAPAAHTPARWIDGAHRYRRLMKVLKPVVTVEGVTPNRGIDADFLSLPRHELADAALSAATAAGATLRRPADSPAQSPRSSSCATASWRPRWSTARSAWRCG